jgi:hypothetical protein
MPERHAGESACGEGSLAAVWSGYGRKPAAKVRRSASLLMTPSSQSFMYWVAEAERSQLIRRSWDALVGAGALDRPAGKVAETGARRHRRPVHETDCDITAGFRLECTTGDPCALDPGASGERRVPARMPSIEGYANLPVVVFWYKAAKRTCRFPRGIRAASMPSARPFFP